MAIGTSVTFAPVAMAAPELDPIQTYRTSAPTAKYSSSRSWPGDPGLTFVLMTTEVAAPLLGANGPGLMIDGSAVQVVGSFALGLGLTVASAPTIVRLVTGTRATVVSIPEKITVDQLGNYETLCTWQFRADLLKLLADEQVQERMEKLRVARVTPVYISVDPAVYPNYNERKARFEIKRPSYLAHVSEELVMGRRRSFRDLQAVSVQVSGEGAERTLVLTSYGYLGSSHNPVCARPQKAQVLETLTASSSHQD